MMARYFFPAAAGALILIVAIVHGSMTQRWSTEISQELDALVEHYKSVPMKVGDWVGEDLAETSDSRTGMVQAHAHAHLSRHYRNQKTGAVVEVLLICGFARDIAIHTPDVCFVGQGYTKEMEPQAIPLPTGESKSKAFVTTFYKQSGEGPSRRRTFWTWNNGSGWSAPQYPRATYPARTPLNKLYLTSFLSGKTDPPAETCEAAQFAGVFLPELSKVLYPHGSK